MLMMKQQCKYYLCHFCLYLFHIFYCRQLQKKFLILDHFLPSEERSRLISLAQFDENTDDWILKKEKKFMSLKERPCIYQYRRPISDYCVGRNTVRCRVSEHFYLHFSFI